MSFSKSYDLHLVAKGVSRDLRKRQTHTEGILWRHLRNRKLLGRKFLRHHPIFHDLLGKETFYVPDFYCASAKLAVEVDGEIHDYGQQGDNFRTMILNHLGITVVRFSNEQVNNHIEDVLSGIAAHLRSGPQETSPLLFPEEKGAGG